MTFNEQLNCKAYTHKYKINDILVLKSSEDLNEVNNILTNVENPDACINAIWYLTQEDIKLLSGRKLRVLSCISWHMGIPFYTLKDMESSIIIESGEFYLKNESSV